MVEKGNVIDHLQLSDEEKIERFMALSKLYTQGGKLSNSAPFKLLTLLLRSRTVYIAKLFKICFDTTTSVLRIRIWDRKNPDPGSGINIPEHISGSLVKNFWV